MTPHLPPKYRSIYERIFIDEVKGKIALHDMNADIACHLLILIILKP